MDRRIKKMANSEGKTQKNIKYTRKQTKSTLHTILFEVKRIKANDAQKTPKQLENMTRHTRDQAKEIFLFFCDFPSCFS